MDPTPITDHAVQALARLVEQFKDADNLKAFITAIVNQIQDIEDTENDMMLFMWIPTAFGVQLDEIGEMVGEFRYGRTDDEYRSAIEFRVLINRSYGEPELIIIALKVLTDADFVRYWELYPASIHLVTDGTPDGSPADLGMCGSIECVTPAGVGITLGVGYDVDNMFAFADDDGGIPVVGLGFAEGDGGSGVLTEQGQIIEVFQ